MFNGFVGQPSRRSKYRASHVFWHRGFNSDSSKQKSMDYSNLQDRSVEKRKVIAT